MPACDHCGKVVKKVSENANGRTVLRLCPMCQSEFDWKQNPTGAPVVPVQPAPWWKRLWNKLGG
jgi:endogenous inhibitor of DNA gyrase (YacG/DUF329 family)